MFPSQQGKIKLGGSAPKVHSESQAGQPCHLHPRSFIPVVIGSGWPCCFPTLKQLLRGKQRGTEKGPEQKGLPQTNSWLSFSHCETQPPFDPQRVSLLFLYWILGSINFLLPSVTYVNDLHDDVSS